MLKKIIINIPYVIQLFVAGKIFFLVGVLNNSDFTLVAVAHVTGMLIPLFLPRVNDYVDFQYREQKFIDVRSFKLVYLVIFIPATTFALILFTVREFTVLQYIIGLSVFFAAFFRPLTILISRYFSSVEKFYILESIFSIISFIPIAFILLFDTSHEILIATSYVTVSSFYVIFFFRSKIAPSTDRRWINNWKLLIKTYFANGAKLISDNGLGFLLSFVAADQLGIYMVSRNLAMPARTYLTFTQPYLAEYITKNIFFLGQKEFRIIITRVLFETIKIMIISFFTIFVYYVITLNFNYPKQAIPVGSIFIIIILLNSVAMWVQPTISFTGLQGFYLLNMLIKISSLVVVFYYFQDLYGLVFGLLLGVIFVRIFSDFYLYKAARQVLVSKRI